MPASTRASVRQAPTSTRWSTTPTGSPGAWPSSRPSRQSSLAPDAVPGLAGPAHELEATAQAAGAFDRSLLAHVRLVDRRAAVGTHVEGIGHGASVVWLFAPCVFLTLVVVALGLGAVVVVVVGRVGAGPGAGPGSGEGPGDE